ncbi:MAG: class I adenylate-forming enzyme family protein [Hyphomicrobiaceae bacterium]
MTSAHGFTGPLPPSRFNMAAYTIGRPAARQPSKPALVVLDTPDGDPAETWTFAGIEDAVLRIAAGLADRGLRPGDRIMLRLEASSRYPLMFFGAIAGGFVPLPTSTHLTPPEAAFLMEDSGAAAVVLADDNRDMVLPAGVMRLLPEEVSRLIRHPRRASWADTAKDDPAYLIYTSGTTSKPKGVLHGHRAVWGRRPMYEGWYGIRASDRMLHAGAFNWTYTLGTGLTDPWANGATALIYAGEKTPEAWPRIIRHNRATIFAAVPSLYRQILKYAMPDRAAFGSDFRHGLIAGETPPAGLFAEWRAATGFELYEALGMSELSTYVSSAPGVPRRDGFVGRPQPGRSLAVLPLDGGEEPLPPGEEGLLAAHASDPGLMLGYWRRPEEEAAVRRGPWFIGGDLAMIDADGYVAHRGRANDIMKALGYRVAPQEVEAAIALHPDVAEVACAEVQVRADVSVIGAFIVARDAARPPAPAAIIAFASERLAPYKCPRKVVVVDTLPRTANGKLKRAALATLRR